MESGNHNGDGAYGNKTNTATILLTELLRCLLIVRTEGISKPDWGYPYCSSIHGVLLSLHRSFR